MDFSWENAPFNTKKCTTKMYVCNEHNKHVLVVVQALETKII